jgi:DNA-binding NtrC family response regulator
VRELENALMRAAILARGTVIGPDHLVLGSDEEDEGDLTLASAVLRHVQKVMGQAAGDPSVAARLLDISEEELAARLEEAGEE